MYEVLREYLDLGERLAALPDQSSPEAERILAAMDMVWYRMSDEERGAIDNADTPRDRPK